MRLLGARRAGRYRNLSLSRIRPHKWTGADKGHAFFAYADNHLIDLKAVIIIDVEATRAIRQAEVGALNDGATLLYRVSKQCPML
jgi:hypothetical protein